MRTLIITIFLFSISIIANAQWEAASWSPMSSTFCVAANDSIIIAGRPMSGIYISTNNGDTWDMTSLPPYCGASKSILIIDSTFFVGSLYGVIRSADWGVSWQLINNGLSDTNITSLTFNGTSIFAGSYSSGVFISSDLGESWTPANSGLSNPYIKKIYVKDSIIYAGTSWFQGGVFISENNGNSWVLSNNGLPDKDLFDILSFQNILFSCFMDNNIYKSEDQGQNWTASNSGLPDSLNLSIYCMFSIGNSIFAGGLSGAFISADNGNSWQEYNQGLSYVGGVGCFTANSTYLFAATGQGVYRRRLTDLSNPEIVGEPDIVKVYPNPASNRFSIEFSSGVNYNRILLYDAQGNLIKKIFDGSLQTKVISVDASDLPVGNYFLKIESENRIDFEKVLILK